MLAHSGSSSVLYCLSSEMSTKNSHFLLSKLGNRSSLNPSCFKEKQRPESDFPGAKVAGIPKSPIRVSAKIQKPPLSPCRTTRILKERSAFPRKSGAVFLSAAAPPTCRSQGSPRRKPAVFFKGFASPFGTRSVLFGTTRHNEFARIKILLKKVNALVREHPKAPLADQGWCSAQRIRILMIAGGNHTIIHAVMAVPRKAMTEGIRTTTL